MTENKIANKIAFLTMEVNGIKPGLTDRILNELPTFAKIRRLMKGKHID